MAKAIVFSDNVIILDAAGGEAKTAADVRVRKVNWNSYLQSQLITEEEFHCIRDLDRLHMRYFVDKSENSIKTLMSLLQKITKDATVQYMLVLIDDLFIENQELVILFHNYAKVQEINLWEPYLNICKNAAQFTVQLASCVLSKLACLGHDLMPEKDAMFFLDLLKKMLVKNVIKVLATTGRCLQLMLRIDEYRYIFVEIDGVSALLNLLSTRSTFQVQYQLIFCLWVITFNPVLAAKMNKFSAVPILADILNDCAKDKVIRIILGFFRNLIEKPIDEQAIKEHCMMMIQCQVLKQIAILEQRKYDDDELTQDIAYVGQTLRLYIKKLSTFEEFALELRSGHLEWSPVHKSTKFWQENSLRLNENNYELLRILVHLLETSRDLITLTVACFDIGEYVLHYPRGKYVMEHLGGKQIVMQYLGHSDANVRYEALVAVQKLMLHN